MTPVAKKQLWRAIASLVITAAVVAVLLLLPPASVYLWLNAVHVIAVIAWMAGMLYLPRLFVYHCKAEPGSQQSKTFKVMEHRLLTVIVNPAMVVVWAVGLWLAWEGPDLRYGWFASGWLLAKLVLVLALSGVHGYLSRWVRDFAADQNRHSEKFYRIINEVPTLLMIAIVLLVIIKPF